MVAIISEEYKLYTEPYTYWVEDNNRLNEVIDFNNEKIELYGKLYNVSQIMSAVCKDLYREEAVSLVITQIEGFIDELLSKHSADIYNNKFELIETGD